MNVLSAKYFYNVDNNTDSIEIKYQKFTPGIGYRIKTDFIYSRPLGNWTEIAFSKDDSVSYTNFLNTMVSKNIEVYRKLARIAHRRILDSYSYKINLLNAIRILDPTFNPPFINLKCGWQCELLDIIIERFSICVISTCKNEMRLYRYFNALQALKVK